MRLFAVSSPAACQAGQNDNAVMSTNNRACQELVLQVAEEAGEEAEVEVVEAEVRANPRPKRNLTPRWTATSCKTTNLQQAS